MSSQPRIVVGITGGIAAYKAVSVVRDFVTSGFQVDVIATEAALNFVGISTLEAISRNPVHVGLYDNVSAVKHVNLGQNANLIVIAPATANTIAQLAHGFAPDLLGNTVLATKAPVLIAPAMHTEMWENPATQANVSLLQARGYHFVGPISGQLTGDDVGIGKMAEPSEITFAAKNLLTSFIPKDLTNKNILITAGGTREPLDPVRYLGNRSSGKQALALAQNALQRGANVTVIQAHVEVEFPATAKVVRVSTAEQLHAEVLQHLPQADFVFMAAAVADYRPSSVSEEKIKKATGQTRSIELVETSDILAEISSLKTPQQIIVGFAAETESDQEKRIEIAREKLLRKGCDFLVLNPVSWEQGFGTDSNSVTLLSATNGILMELEANKADIAEELLTIVTT